MWRRQKRKKHKHMLLQIEMSVIKKREGEGVEYCYLNKIRKGLIIWHLRRSLEFKPKKQGWLERNGLQKCRISSMFPNLIRDMELLKQF